MNKLLLKVDGISGYDYFVAGEGSPQDSRNKVSNGLSGACAALHESVARREESTQYP